MSSLPQGNIFLYLPKSSDLSLDLYSLLPENKEATVLATTGLIYLGYSV